MSISIKVEWNMNILEVISIHNITRLANFQTLPGDRPIVLSKEGLD